MTLVKQFLVIARKILLNIGQQPQGSMKNDDATLTREGTDSHMGRSAGIWAALGCAGLIASVAHPAQAAVTQAWVQRYNHSVSNATDQVFMIVCDGAGDVIVVGRTDDNVTGNILTIKYSGVDGSVIWLKRDNGPGNSSALARAVAVDYSGNVVITGGYDNGTNGSSYTAKYAGGDGALLWEKSYNAGGGTEAIALDGNNNVVVTGISSYSGITGRDYYTAKFAAANGALLWEQRYNGRPGNNYDAPHAVAVDSSGNVVVTGISQNGSPRYDYDFSTVKYAAADGALLWEKSYNSPANESDFAITLAVDAGDNVVVTGYTGARHFYTAKYAAADGALLWEKSVGSVNGDPRSVAVDNIGNVVVTGNSYSYDPNNGSEQSDYYTAKYAAGDGALLWERRYNGAARRYDSARAVAADGSGNVVVTGISQNATNFDFYTAKYAAADGALLWEKRYNGPANGDDYAVALALDARGNVTVTGTSAGVENGSDGYTPNSDWYTAKYAAGDGTLLWEKRYAGQVNYDDIPRAVAMDRTGNVIVTGYSYGSPYNGANTDYYTAKYSAADGALLWEKRYNGPINVSDQARALAVDGDGNVIVTGYVDYAAPQYLPDFYTAKYAAADGALLWENRYNGPANRSDIAEAVAADNNGNVVVTGSSYNGTNDDYYTAKYSANGALLWEKRYNGPGNSSDQARAVAVDGNGNVVVTGTSATIKYLPNGTEVWTNGSANAVAVDGNGNVFVTGPSGTIKYQPNGTGVWTNRYVITLALNLALDGGGNVIVTGFSYNGRDDDYYTAKYAGVTGALLWEKRNGSASSNHQAQAVALDRGGNVVVTGSANNGSNNDYYTAKYAAADGALLWEKRYNGPANGADVAVGIAVGPNGMVAITGYSNAGLGPNTVYDYVTILYRETLPSVSIEKVATGFRLRFPGVAGHSYNVERASAVTGLWSTNATLTAVTNGLLEYIDTHALPGSAFYRMSTGP